LIVSMPAIDPGNPPPRPAIPPLPPAGSVRSADRGRLLRLRSRLRSAGPEQAPGLLAQYRDLAERSALAVVQRRARLPVPVLDGSLPIHAQADRLVELLARHRVVVVAGETGSGKTTQLPKLALAAGRGAAGMIGCTQPRRIAARSVARRVAEELGGSLGELVGYQVRFDDRVGADTAIKFMTDGILLAQAQGDRWLSDYDTIIVDEAHERSLNIDFLLGLLKGLLARRDDLKVVVTSATIDTARFAAFFDGAPVVEIPGRAFPVQRRYRPLAERERDDRGLGAALVETVAEITREDPLGDVLVFLPGEREIRDAHRLLGEQKLRHTQVLPLYARLSANDQDRVFKPGRERRIVLATNVAETSLTVPRIRHVIDAGTARVSRYSPRSKVQRLEIEPVARANAEQRAGRCGRTGPGIAWRLYDEADFEARPQFADPEILRSSLANVILRMLALGLGDIEAFPFLDPPPERAIKEGLQQLAELQAMTPERALTATGKAMAAFPIDVQLARMLVEARRLGSLRELLAIAAFLSIQDPRERPAEVRQQADARHAEFADARSDFLGAWNLWQAFDAAHAELGSSKLRAWCQERFLNYMRMREWRELHRQLLGLVDQAGWSLEATAADGQATEPPAEGRGHGRPRAGSRARAPSPTTTAASAPPHLRSAESGRAQAGRYAAIHRAILAGLPANVARKGEKGLYEGTRSRGFAIFPGSAVAKAQPAWLLSLSVIVTSRAYAHGNARIEPDWLYDQAGHLLKRSVSDPFWDRDRGRVVAYEQASLFGLVIHARKRVDFAASDPAGARAIFLREALATCDLQSRSDFVEANAAVLAQAHEREAMQRRQGLVVDADIRAQWLQPLIPAEVNSTKALDAWYRTLAKPQRAALRWTLDDLLVADTGDADYPRSIELAGRRFDLDYVFRPGDEADGVTLVLPLAWLNAVPAARLDWLVPGLLPARVAELIRTLAKPLRRNFVPAPDFARAFVEAEPARAQPLVEVLAAWMRRTSGVQVDGADFDPGALPPHLHMRVLLLGRDGEPVAAGRDLAALQRSHGGQARQACAERAAGDFARSGLVQFEPETIPEWLENEAGLRAFPALVDRGEHVDLVVFETAEQAAQAHAGGVRRLLGLRLADARRRLARGLALDARAQFAWASIGSLDALRADLVDGALAGLLAQSPPVRSRAAFDALAATLAADLGRASAARALLARNALAALADTSPALAPPLLGFAAASFQDLRAQQARLFPADLGRSVPDRALAEYPRYLKAMALRAERLQADPRRDQARMLLVQAFERRLAALPERRETGAEREALRWLLEELRVSLFAQELGTREPVSEKRVEKRLQVLESG
jgi:ATP-dependent helicase HrpA